jgi:hypothetical protein
MKRFDVEEGTPMEFLEFMLSSVEYWNVAFVHCECGRKIVCHMERKENEKEGPFPFAIVCESCKAVTTFGEFPCPDEFEWSREKIGNA